MANKDALRDAVFKAVEAYCAADYGYSFDQKKPIVRLHEPTFAADEINAAVECLLSTYVTMGPKVKKFEDVFASTFGWTDGVMNNSGSSANLLAVAALANPATEDGLKPGERIVIDGVGKVRAGQPVMATPADTSALPTESAPPLIEKVTPAAPSGGRGVAAPQPPGSGAPTPSASPPPSQR